MKRNLADGYGPRCGQEEAALPEQMQMAYYSGFVMKEERLTDRPD